MRAIYEADLHTHTVASGHAYGTITENAKVASARGLEAIAMTDHGPALGSIDPYFFTNLRVIPDELYGVRILKSIEANVMGLAGELDLEDAILRKLDLVVAGLHNPELLYGIADSDKVSWCTEALCAAIRNPNVDVIAHPGNPTFPVDAEKVVREAVRYGKALEINNNSFIARPGSVDSCNRIARLCANHGALVSVSSDAHFPLSIGDVVKAAKMAKDAGIMIRQIVNSTIPNLNNFLDERSRRLTGEQDKAAS